MFPIHVHAEDSVYPEDGSYYVIAGNGVFFNKNNGIVSGLVKVENVSFLPDLEERFSTTIPPVPEEIVYKVKAFFDAVLEKHHSEANVVLYYNKTTQQYHAHVPKQVVGPGSVHYAMAPTNDIKEGYLMIGTIHSHCNFRAFHSGTDVDDEKHFDGLHVTFGDNNQEHFTISATACLNGRRKKIDPLTVLKGVEHHNDDRYSLTEIKDQNVDDWLKNVKKAELTFGMPFSIHLNKKELERLSENPKD